MRNSCGSQASIIFFLLLLVLSFSTCQKEISRVDDFWVEFATVVKVTETTAFQLDNNKILIPNEPEKHKFDAGKRVIMSYSPLRNDTVKINWVTEIFTGEIQILDPLTPLYTDPIYIQSIWVAGNYLNLIFEVEYNSQSHSMALLRDASKTPIELYLSYSRNNDPRGYSKKTYASFSLMQMKLEAGAEVPFQLFVNTYDGLRTFNFSLK